MIEVALKRDEHGAIQVDHIGNVAEVTAALIAAAASLAYDMDVGGTDFGNIARRAWDVEAGARIHRSESHRRLVKQTQKAFDPEASEVNVD